MTVDHHVDTLVQTLGQLSTTRLYGRVTKILGMLVEIGGVETELSVGDRCILMPKSSEPVPCEIVGFRDGKALAMPFKPLDRVGLGCRAELAVGQATIRPSVKWLGRVINALGEPIGR